MKALLEALSPLNFVFRFLLSWLQDGSSFPTFLSKELEKVFVFFLRKSNKFLHIIGFVCACFPSLLAITLSPLTNNRIREEIKGRDSFKV